MYSTYISNLCIFESTLIKKFFKNTDAKLSFTEHLYNRKKPYTSTLTHRLQPNYQSYNLYTSRSRFLFDTVIND